MVGGESWVKSQAFIVAPPSPYCLMRDKLDLATKKKVHVLFAHDEKGGGTTTGVPAV